MKYDGKAKRRSGCRSESESGGGSDGCGEREVERGRIKRISLRKERGRDNREERESLVNL